VRIVDLARNLLELSGVRNPGAHVIYTGLRPGERLHEELVAPDETTMATAHAKVRIIRSRDGSCRSVIGALAGWEDALEDGLHGELVEAMAEYCGGIVQDVPRVHTVVPRVSQ
jgi:FlaA1/EpsC-like NDP-sugar epimerase